MLRRIKAFNRRISTRNKVMTLVFVSFLILFIMVDLYEYGMHVRILNGVSNRSLEHSIEDFSHLKESDIKTLSITLETLLADETIRDIYQEGNREKLYDYTFPFLKKIKEEYGITHWYFINPEPESTSFLRVHNFEIFGDRISRTTYVNSVEDKDFGVGFELGKTAFALRVVHPYYSEGGELIGYMELGEEIDQFLKTMKQETGSEFKLFALKEYLDRDDWTAAREVKGLRDNWDDAEDILFIEETSDLAIDVDMDLKDIPEEGAVLGRITVSGIRYSKSVFPVYDTEGRKIGGIFVIADVSEYYSEFYQNLLWISLIFLAIFVAIGFFLYKVFGKISKELEDEQLNLKERIKELNCLYTIANLSTKSNISLDEIITDAAKTIPPSWQYSEITCARIIIEDKEYRTDNFKIAEWKQSSPVRVDKKTVGTIEVYYLEERPEIYEGPFLKEERHLIVTLANMVGNIIRNRKTVKELKETRNWAVQASRDAVAANETKSRFLANMSHEIRTPMNAILGFSELLENLIKEPKQRQYLSSIRSSGKALLALINDILDLSKIEAGKIEIQYGAVNLEKLFDEIVMLFATRAKEKGLRLLTVIDKELPNALHLDEVRIRQVLINLIGNAIKFTEKGYIKLEAKGIYHKNQSKINLQFSVKDTGIGISSENKKVIFDPFKQSKKQSVGKYGGTGLGLSITKKLLELMEGTISLDSSIGKGSNFTVILKNIAVASLDDISNGGEDTLPANIRFKKQTILIADDIESNRILLRESLKSYGLQTIDAVDGKQAIDMAREYSPDLILMDLRMPVMDGYEAIKILKADSILKDIPIFVLTASAMKEEQEKINNLNCEGYLRKPIEKNKLLRELIRFLAYSGDKAESGKEEIKAEEDKTAGATIDATGKMVDEGLTPGQKKKLPELIKLMEGKLKDDHIKVTESFIMDDIKDFAARVEKLGKEYNIVSIHEWADKITSQAESFDMENLPATLDHFKGLTDKVKKLLN